MRDAVPAVADGAVVRIAKLVVATPGASLQFVRELTRSWSVVGSIVTTDQQIVRNYAIVFSCIVQLI